jgi:glycosyltransferase involved in cell wall biosynthesis
MNTQVLYISYDGMTDPLGQSQVLPYICGLAAKGYQITLLSCEKPERFTQFKNIIEDICKQANINWQQIQYTSKPPILSTIKDIRAIQQRAFNLHQKHQFQIVHCRSYIAAMVGLKMKQKFNTKFLFDMRGFWADERVDGGIWSLKNPLYNLIYKFFKKKEKQYFENADHIISLTFLGKEVIQSWKQLQHQPLPITVIPCCVDTTLFDSANITTQQKEQLRTQLNIAPNTQVVGYVGSIGTWYMLDEMLACYKVMKERNNNTKILFVTTEPKEMVINKAISMGIDVASIIVTPVPRKEVPLYISIMSYSLFFIKPCFSKQASSPTKQGEIMAMGIPVLCNTGVGDTGFVVEKYHSGVAISEFSENDFVTAIDTITNTHYSPADIRKGAIDFYGLQKGIENYVSVYQKLSQ